MFDRIFGNYLVETDKLTKEQLISVYEEQESSRSRLGIIAVTEQMMTVKQVDEVNKKQAVMDMRFGDIAVSSGYLLEEQVSRLLKLQGNRYLTFVQGIVDQGYLSLEELNSTLDSYQKEKGYSRADIENLKSCDIDRVLPYFINIKSEPLMELTLTFIRTVARLIDYHVYIDPSNKQDEQVTPYISYQMCDGDHHIFVGLAGDEASLMQSAIDFAGEKFIEDLDDALDANAEFINCVNGLYATKASNDETAIEIDMYPPMYHSEETKVVGVDMKVIPICFKDTKLNLIVSIDSDIQVK